MPATASLSLFHLLTLLPRSPRRKLLSLLLLPLVLLLLLLLPPRRLLSMMLRKPPPLQLPRQWRSSTKAPHSNRKVALVSTTSLRKSSKCASMTLQRLVVVVEDAEARVEACQVR